MKSFGTLPLTLDAHPVPSWGYLVLKTDTTRLKQKHTFSIEALFYGARNFFLKLASEPPFALKTECCW